MKSDNNLFLLLVPIFYEHHRQNAWSENFTLIVFVMFFNKEKKKWKVVSFTELF